MELKPHQDPSRVRLPLSAVLSLVVGVAVMAWVVTTLDIQGLWRALVWGFGAAAFTIPSAIWTRRKNDHKGIH